MNPRNVSGGKYFDSFSRTKTDVWPNWIPTPAIHIFAYWTFFRSHLKFYPAGLWNCRNPRRKYEWLGLVQSGQTSVLVQQKEIRNSYNSIAVSSPVWFEAEPSPQKAFLVYMNRRNVSGGKYFDSFFELYEFRISFCQTKTDVWPNWIPPRHSYFRLGFRRFHDPTG